MENEVSRWREVSLARPERQVLVVRDAPQLFFAEVERFSIAIVDVSYHSTEDPVLRTDWISLCENAVCSRGSVLIRFPVLPTPEQERILHDVLFCSPFMNAVQCGQSGDFANDSVLDVRVCIVSTENMWVLLTTFCDSAVVGMVVSTLLSSFDGLQHMAVSEHYSAIRGTSIHLLTGLARVADSPGLVASREPRDIWTIGNGS